MQELFFLLNRRVPAEKHRTTETFSMLVKKGKKCFISIYQKEWNDERGDEEQKCIYYDLLPYELVRESFVSSKHTPSSKWTNEKQA